MFHVPEAQHRLCHLSHQLFVTLLIPDPQHPVTHPKPQGPPPIPWSYCSPSPQEWEEQRFGIPLFLNTFILLSLSKLTHVGGASVKCLYFRRKIPPAIVGLWLFHWDGVGT